MTAAAPAALALALACASCALPPPAPAPLPAPAAGGAVDSARVAPAPAAAAIDSGPSPGALEVLATIPEPLPPSVRVPPPGGDPEPPPESLPEPPIEGAAAEDDTAGAEVPVPSPTFPLGQEPPPEAAPDTVLEEPPPDPAPGAPPSSGSSAAPPAPRRDPDPPPRAPARPDTCWRVQIGAPTERAKADAVRRAGASLLLLPMVIERERGLYKVRTRDCWDRATADRIKERALASDFKGAFRFVAKGR